MKVIASIVASALFAVSSPAIETIRVVGSDLLGESFTKAVSEFARQNDVEVKLNLRGTRLGVEELKARGAEVGLFLLPPGERPPAETLVSKAFAYQVAVVVVPDASPLKQVTVPQLRGMFGLSAGEAFSRWGELNLIGEWSSRPIVLRALAPKSDLIFPLFKRVVLDGGDPKAGLELVSDDAALTSRMLATPSAVAVTGFLAEGRPGLRALAIAATPSASAYAPTPETIHGGDYALRLPLYVTFPRESAQELQSFIKFLLSDEVAAALAPGYFVGLPQSARNDLIFELEEIR